MTAGKQGKRLNETDSKYTSPSKVQRLTNGVPATITINCGGPKFQCRRETLLHLGSSFLETLADLDPDENDELFLDFKPEAFAFLLDALRLARTNLPQAMLKVQQGLQKLAADLEDLLQYLGLEWLVGTTFSLQGFVSCPVAVLRDELHGLYLAGVLQHLSQNQLSPRTYKGSCSKGEEFIHVSEELNGLASLRKQKEEGHSSLVAQMLKIKPFSRFPKLEDFRDFNCPELPWDPPSPMTDDEYDFQYDDAYHQHLYQQHLELEYEEGYIQHYGIPLDLDTFGLRRHVIDVGPRRFLCLSTVVVAYSGSLLKQDCTLQIQASCDGFQSLQTGVRKVGAKIPTQQDPKKVILIKVHTESPLIGRLFALTVIPHSYDRRAPKTVQLEALEFYGTFIDVPKQLSLTPSPCFRFDAASDKFRQVEAYRED